MSTAVHLAVVDSYERPDLCGPCGGLCCKEMPGVTMPSDLGATDDDIRTGLIDRLASGRWAIDWWEGDPRPDVDELWEGYYLRPSISGNEGVLQDPGYGGRCTFLSPSGCAIFESRPSGCRGLEPGVRECTTRHSGKREAAIAWVPYRSAILDALRKLEES